LEKITIYIFTFPSNRLVFIPEFNGCTNGYPQVEREEGRIDGKRSVYF
jgi:hypothetical protein